MNFIAKNETLEHAFQSGDHTMTARQAVELLEQILRYLLQHQTPSLGTQVFIRIREAEQFVGKGQTTLNDFPLEKLLAVFRRARVLDSWELSQQQELTGIRLLNLDELPRLRNKFIQEHKEATQTEAELLRYCVRVFLETFDLAGNEAVLSNI